MNIHGIMIAGVRSGSGKTTITCGIIKALTRRGLNVHAFKCGPDYIDPMFHNRVLGVPSKNLDLFFTNEETTRGLYASGNDSDISVIEGVMGLYDGIGGISLEASSYHLADTLKTPVVLVLDAHGMGRSIIAELKGFLALDDSHLIKGVILNRVSASLYETIKPVIEKETATKVLGYFPKTENIGLESRHLGLVLPSEINELETTLGRVADIVDECIDIDGLLGLADGTDIIEPECQIVEPPIERRVAIALDEAFCFYYEDNLKMLKKAGVKLIPFSPVHDDRLPDNIDGLILGGGYPELYLEQLSNNKSMLASVRSAILAGLPSIAECGGFMYLHDEIKDRLGTSYSMAGVIKGSCEYRGKLVRFGYLTIEEKTSNYITTGDGRIKGHEFHYYDSTNNGSDCVSVKPDGIRSWESAHVTDTNWWGFAHLYYPSNPEFVKAFVGKLGGTNGKQS